MNPSAHTISTPLRPASTKGAKSRCIHSWKSRWPATDRAGFVKQVSFITGMYPIRMVACADGLHCVALSMFPMVRYTGHALLLPRNCESDVLSDDRINGAIVAPFGSFCCTGCKCFCLNRCQVVFGSSLVSPTTSLL